MMPGRSLYSLPYGVSPETSSTFSLCDEGVRQVNPPRVGIGTGEATSAAPPPPRPLSETR